MQRFLSTGLIAIFDECPALKTDKVMIKTDKISGQSGADHCLPLADVKQNKLTKFWGGRGYHYSLLEKSSIKN